MKKLFLVLLISTIASFVFSQSLETLQIRRIRELQESEWLKEYIHFLAIPNIASNPAGLQKNAEFIMQMMKKRNIQQVKLLNGVTKNTAPAIYGEVNTPGAKKTLIFYAHYDGQPVDSSQWAKGLDPFVPKLITGSLEKGAVMIPFPTADTKFDPNGESMLVEHLTIRLE